ncbi:hypothetical protein [Streptosporangium sp. NPDC087985]|uniref:hypothetical protein n=1 Tax=Streptosporangium sp. NPDC087985 TaxID=3366196 RepID=UPI00381F4DB7
MTLRGGGERIDEWLTGHDREAVLAEVVASYRSCLRSAGSIALSEETVVEQLVHQASLVVDDVVSRCGGTPSDGDTGSLPFSMEIGVTRAQQGMHPTQSLLAAALMFEAAFPILAHRLAGRVEGSDQEKTIAIGLERCSSRPTATRSLSWYRSCGRTSSSWTSRCRGRVPGQSSAGYGRPAPRRQ